MLVRSLPLRSIDRHNCFVVIVSFLFVVSFLFIALSVDHNTLGYVLRSQLYDCKNVLNDVEMLLFFPIKTQTQCFHRWLRMSVKQKIVTKMVHVIFPFWFYSFGLIFLENHQNVYICIDVHCSCKRFNTFLLIDQHSTVHIFWWTMKKWNSHGFMVMRISFAFEYDARS